MPCRRHSSAVPVPAAYSFRIRRICSVENLPVRIWSSQRPRTVENAHDPWTSFRGHVTVSLARNEETGENYSVNGCLPVRGVGDDGRDGSEADFGVVAQRGLERAAV